MKNYYTNNVPRILSTFCVFFLLQVIGNAQPMKQKDIKEFIWGETNTFKASKFPDSLQNESAVILLDEYKYDYSKFTPLFTNSFAAIRVREHYIHRRILKLNDRAAVQNFSELEFTEASKNQGLLRIGNKDKKFFGLRIIKPNGEINEIDLENDKIKISSADEQAFKIAVEGLEPGDTIDYYTCTIESWERNSFVFDSFETIFKDEYPILKFSFGVKLENDFFINHNSFKGASSLKQTSEEENVKEYALEVNTIKKRNENRWLYSFMEYPSFKFQVSFARSKKRKNEVNSFLADNTSIIKNEVSADDILKHYKDDYNFDLSLKWIKKYFKNKKDSIDNRQLIEEAYYLMRHYYLNRYIEGAVAIQENLVNPSDDIYQNSIVITKEKQFLTYFGSFLKNNNIPFEIIKAKNRYDGNIDDLLLESNLITLLKVNLDDPIYIYPFSNSTFFNWIPYALENTEAYSLQFDKKYKQIEKVKKSKLPSSLYADNNEKEIIKIDFSDTFSKIIVHKESFYKGHNKIRVMSDRLFFFDYIQAEYKKYQTTSFAGFLKKKNRKKYDKTFPAYKTQIIEKQRERLKQTTQDEFDFTINDYSYDLINEGRKSVNDTLHFKEQFNIQDDLIQRAGSNFIFKVGKLIGQQIAIKEKEKSRTENIYMPYSRSFDNEIRITIPDGYMVSDYEKLNMNTENETGGFNSEASMNGSNMLIIKTHKFYRNNYEPNSSWGKMLEFLEASYQFSQQKILLKKV